MANHPIRFGILTPQQHIEWSDILSLYLAVIIEMACVPMIGGYWLTAAVFSLGNAAPNSAHPARREVAR